jgi:hypothetical protein
MSKFKKYWFRYVKFANEQPIPTMLICLSIGMVIGSIWKYIESF